MNTGDGLLIRPQIFITMSQTMKIIFVACAVLVLLVSVLTMTSFSGVSVIVGAFVLLACFAALVFSKRFKNAQKRQPLMIGILFGLGLLTALLLFVVGPM